MLLLTGTAIAADALEIEITYLGRAGEPIIPLSLLDMPVEDNGIPGSVLGLKDSQTTGNFLNHIYKLDHVILEPEENLAERFKKLTNNGAKLFIADLGAADLQSLKNLSADALILNVQSMDDSLRNQNCDARVLHLPPSRAMVADALAQYLAWKRWREVVLVTGRHAQDKLYANSLHRAIERYGLKLVQEKNWTAEPGARRTDSGHHTLQQEVPVFTRFKEHDVVLVADERDEFGEYLTYRSTSPRPVAGTQGLIPTAWHRTQEQWGATQIQRRFTKLAGRTMTERDYAAWLAMRAFSDAVTNTSSADPSVVREFLLSDKLKLAGFKGAPLSFRQWNGQLRQPVLLAGPRMLVSVSPQKGFLHEVSELDTLGYDKPESACTDFQE
ncbi:hypothetical protein AB833_20775 [Chromatiales bacterium (ex Bugula neritina AB1)]|nr:hypothetical protein AB833_20775 [Chromatiales bacterium (ex Bugula neritina AB1)]